jgi:hypothetical protein
MDAITRVPQNTNYLQPTKFLLTFERIGSVQYFCQAINLPGINLGQAPINLPTLDIYAPGNKLTYNQLNIDFNVDENLDSWRLLYDWFLSIASPTSFDERKRLTGVQNKYTRIEKTALKSYSDATLTVLNNLNNPKLRVRFVNAFPTSLSDLQFDTKMSADDIMTATASFMYDYFEFEPLT